LPHSPCADETHCRWVPSPNLDDLLSGLAAIQLRGEAGSHEVAAISFHCLGFVRGAGEATGACVWRPGMLDDPSRRRSPGEPILRRFALKALGLRALEREREDAQPISTGRRVAAIDDELPAIVVKAQEDARCQRALARLGYAKVRSEYARHRRERRDLFLSLDPEFLWPTMDFVRAWLKAEKKRLMARMRWTFVSAMLATIIAGLAFMAALSILH
jgi:hypothetical protein